MTPTKRTKVAALAAAAAALTLGHASCVQSDGQTYGPGSTGGETSSTANGSNPSGFDKHALLASLGNLIAAETSAFAEHANALDAATTLLAEDGSEEHLTAARAAFRAAVLAWQRLEPMQIGPAAPSVIPGGRDLRDTIYSWPSINRCAVDQELTKSDYVSPETLATKLINVRGLGALERLLFEESTENACGAPNSINTTGSWSAIVDELPARRARYAASAATLVAQAAGELRDAWAVDKGNFVAQLSEPSDTYDSDPAKALDAVAYALLYLDTRTKDLKLAVPAGLTNCAKETCPEALELGEAKLSKDAVRANLLGFQTIYHGGAPFDAGALGFDDWLTALGATELRAELAAAIAAAISAVDAIEGDDLAVTLAKEPKRLEDVHLAVRNVLDLFKAQVVTVLDLHPPSDAPTDND